ncbi:MAG: hypothetical protein KDJ36_08525 [Hyphomicrobiaceae bacterium]|nr:hypothetical protein [Hyphomicrobiaceae bacterium]
MNDETEVWVSRAMMDTTLIKGFDSDIYEADEEKALLGLRMTRRAEIVTPDQVPKIMWLKPTQKLKNAPDLFLGGGYWIASAALADVLRQFDLGETKLYPVSLFRSDRKTPFDGEHFCVAFGEIKDTALPELSPRLGKVPYRTDPLWTLSLAPEDGDVALSPGATQGVDLWMEPKIRDAFFLSRNLVTALRAAKLTKRLGLTRCRVIRPN